MTWFGSLIMWLAVLWFAIWIIRKELQELKEVRSFRRQLDHHDNHQEKDT